MILREERAEAIAARLPIPSFYARARWVNLASATAEAQQCEKLEKFLKGAGVNYVVTDQTIERESPLIRSCLSGLGLLAEFKKGEDHVKIYFLGTTR